MLEWADRLSPQVRAELPENGCIHRNACRFAMRLTCNPSEHGLIETPFSALHLVLLQEPVECQKRELGPRISVPQIPLEEKKTPEFAGKATFKTCVHLGTGSVTCLNLRNATRTYTEVEEGRR